MKRPITTCAGLFICASMAAQGSMTTPPGGLPTEGGAFAYLMGAWSEMRIQQADDMHSDGKAKAIAGIAFRLDYQAHSSSTATGRTWSRITVVMSEPATFDTMTTTFASNHGKSPTLVFDSKWTWPTHNGTPLLQPAVWGGVGGQLRFPFAKPWVYTGKDSILADYTFRGGTLANNGPWGNNQLASFFLDGENNSATANHASLQQFPNAAPQCYDSKVTPMVSANVSCSAMAYGKHEPTVTLRGKLRFSHYSFFTAPGAPVIHALGMSGLPNGANIGAGCNSLYVDLSKPVTFVSLMAQSTYGLAAAPGYTTEWRNGFARMELWMQAAWAESSSKRLMLTTALKAVLPSGLPSGQPRRYKTVFQFGATFTVGLGPLLIGGFPYTRYGIQ